MSNDSAVRDWLRRAKCLAVRLRTGTRVKVRGQGNRVEISRAMLHGVTIEISGRGNELTIGPGARLWGAAIKLRGNNLRCVIGAYCKLRHVRYTVEDDGSRLLVGNESSGTGCSVVVCEGGLVQVGRDCMMSADADVRNTDGHSVLDQLTGRRINPAADVVLGDHVWIGLKAQILKGVRIGEHSIVAAGSVVIRDVPAHTIVAGIPAKPVKTGITWDRLRLPVAAAEPALTVTAA
ncbi:acyltransferase [Opitutus terrae]|uniref:Acetyltransferase with hexapeptide repeat n=1 Tax=Opitutus terrae (strain DSM 11246 / JCM 15787 / PB90-1) TaxID=452637 RepID=B1ZT92_OPITP|nr:acyltransferase [Opitutus terrae]ACB76546.1 acetyltransferase with hexapeptide repeat [Opitutus terrae PB90-1]